MIVRQFTSRFLGANSYVIACENSNEAAVIDTGTKPGPVLELIAARGWKIRYILNTHGHLDHIWYNQDIQRVTGTPIHIHQGDAQELDRFRWYLPPIKQRTRVSPSADVLLQDGEKLPLGIFQIEVLHTPGHSAGSVCFRVKKHIFSGDTLFAGGIGRVDLKGGDLSQILGSIRERLLVLSDDIKVHPGHGPETTIERERLYNPFLRTKEQTLEKLMVPKKKWKAENK